MKLYNYSNFLKESDDNSIQQICREYSIENYTINSDGSIDVDGNVSLSRTSHSVRKRLFHLPLNFNKVSGYFDCYGNALTTLEGSPNYVGGYFNCALNNLTSLDGCPKYIGASFICRDNRLRDFKGFPESFEGMTFFEYNPVNEILKPIPSSKESTFIHLLNEYDVIRNRMTIIRDRFEAAYEGIGMELPDDINIYGYEII